MTRHPSRIQYRLNVHDSSFGGDFVYVCTLVCHVHFCRWEMTLGVFHCYFLDVVSFEFFGSKPSSDRSNCTHCMYLCMQGIDEVCGSYHSFHTYERMKLYECLSALCRDVAVVHFRPTELRTFGLLLIRILVHGRLVSPRVLCGDRHTACWQ